MVLGVLPGFYLQTDKTVIQNVHLRLVIELTNVYHVTKVFVYYNIMKGLLLTCAMFVQCFC